MIRESAESRAGATPADARDRISLLFLSWECPWPAHGGAGLRTLGLLRELAPLCDIDLIVLTRRPLSTDQANALSELSRSVTRVALRDVTTAQKLHAALTMAIKGLPYHSAVLHNSLKQSPAVRDTILMFPGLIFTSVGHWGALVRGQSARRWILNQCDADIDFWRVYASNARNLAVKLMALLNWRLSQRVFPSIYRQVGRIISVCEEDRELTLAAAPQMPVEVIENGVDCAYFYPEPSSDQNETQMLFTGTSSQRNVLALEAFVKGILPEVQRQVADASLLVAGNFVAQAQRRFADVHGLRFTGRVDDIRPYYNQSALFIAPFRETHGSKLKIAQAMAMGMPIVSTPQGIRGFSLANGESVLVAHSDAEFAAQIVRLMRDPELRARLGKAAREVALRTIDWAVLGKRLRAIVSQVYSMTE
jgi:glycosyltransferase involved in cell wall biosynthesis